MTKTTPAQERAELAERVYTTAVAFNEAEADPESGRHLKAARYADYMDALSAHAAHFIHEYINTRNRSKA